MNFIHTFYSKPLLENKFDKYENLIDVIITDYTYSAYCIKKILNQRIILYTDKIGAKILSHIPYDEIKILDFNSSIDFAASIKFEAIRDMTEDDVLIDGDLFLQTNQCLDLINQCSEYDFLYSFFEPSYYTLRFERDVNKLNIIVSKLKEKENLFVEPYVLPKTDSDFSWPNTSFMKFNNIELKQKYIDQYLFFKKELEDIDFGKAWPDIIIEQYHMKKLLEFGNYSSRAIIENFPTNEANNFALEIGFTHLGGRKVEVNQMFKNKFLDKFGKDEFDKMQNQIFKLKYAG